MKCRATKPKFCEEKRLEREIELKEYHREYRNSNRLKLRVKKREYYESAKSEGIKAYGGKCSCCGEAETKFLTLEHKDGRTKHDKLTGKKAWAKVRALNYPDNYTVLCFNCNCCKGAYGRCAHEEQNK